MLQSTQSCYPIGYFTHRIYQGTEKSCLIQTTEDLASFSEKIGNKIEAIDFRARSILAIMEVSFPSDKGHLGLKEITVNPDSNLHHITCQFYHPKGTQISYLGFGWNCYQISLMSQKKQKTDSGQRNILLLNIPKELRYEVTVAAGSHSLSEVCESLNKLSSEEKVLRRLVVSGKRSIDELETLQVDDADLFESARVFVNKCDNRMKETNTKLDSEWQTEKLKVSGHCLDS